MQKIQQFIIEPITFVWGVNIVPEAGLIFAHIAEVRNSGGIMTTLLSTMVDDLVAGRIADAREKLKQIEALQRTPSELEG